MLALDTPKARKDRFGSMWHRRRQSARTKTTDLTTINIGQK